MFHTVLRPALRLVPLLALSSSPGAQAFLVNTFDIPTSGPANNSATESVDFGDIDLDGDWDAVFADGGELGNDQNRVWINIGGLQGGDVGTFEDETALRLPVFADTSRDLDLADIDGDLDLDIYIANTSFTSNQGNRWWVNQGSPGGAAPGFYVDETAARWVGLGSPQSSVPTQLLIPNAAAPVTFIDWSCDCDFADLDADGDLDLVHSSYGNVFSGGVPTRLYLNDGDGFYEEFNPSGFKLTLTTLTEGDPGLWCEGVYVPETSVADGTECDVATTALDTDLGDLDGDFDLDILHGARNELPRVFQNRSSENGGALGFRDVTGAAFDGLHATGNGHYEQELGDLDNDGDLDLYGCNWLSSFELEDAVFENDGTGRFTAVETLDLGSSADAEGDFLDYDQDGDLDLFVVGFMETRLYRNSAGEPGGGFSFDNASTLLPLVPEQSSLDGDCVDVDGDGDTDVFEANVGGQPNRFWENITDTPDTTAPRIPRLERVQDGAAEAGTELVRAHVFDNAPYYVVYAQPTELIARVDGVELPALPMRSSGGQVFQARLPANLVGEVEYLVRSTDDRGNTGLSVPARYRNTGETGVASGIATPSSVGVPSLLSLTAPLTGMPLHLLASGVAPGVSLLFAFSTSPAAPLDLGDGLLLQLGPALTFPPPAIATAGGTALLSVSEVGSAAAGATFYGQFFAVDGVGGDTWASSNRLELTFR